MLDRIINILVMEADVLERNTLMKILKSPGHNVFVAADVPSALSLIEEKNFVIIFCNLDFPNIDPDQLLADLHARNSAKNSTIIISSFDKEKVYANVGHNDKHDAVDYLIKPYVPHLVMAKTKVYKKLFIKHDRVSQLLERILPNQTLTEYRTFGKSSPKKKTNCTVLFTDFVDFTLKTKGFDPQVIVRKLDYYFSKFDQIIQKYKLEKIKTIGDAYMVVGGVTENDSYPAIRTALAAIEMRNFVNTEIETNKALNRDYWEMRIGIHAGDLVAGVVGEYKFSFDVWGDTVNLAARCEQNSEPNRINISSVFFDQIATYFDCTPRGSIEVKNGGKIGMYFLDAIKTDYSLNGEGRTFSVGFREKIGMPTTDFEGIRSFIITKLKAELPDQLFYHSAEHTLNVEKAIIKYGELERVDDHSLFILRTAGLFHDAGFLYKYDHNEKLGAELFEMFAPIYGYKEEDIQLISEIILSTSYHAPPKNLLEAIMCDADLDYLGRMDYHATAKKLINEMLAYGKSMTTAEWLDLQIEYLENQHRYHTISAQNLRNPGKLRRIEELKVIRGF